MRLPRPLGRIVIVSYDPAAGRAGISLFGYRDLAAVMAALSPAAIAVVPSRWQEPVGLAARRRLDQLRTELLIP
jgi:hypothetical protein